MARASFITTVGFKDQACVLELKNSNTATVVVQCKLREFVDWEFFAQQKTLGF